MSRGGSILAVLAAVLYLAWPTTWAHAAPRTYALLVGVSEYPALEAGLQLHGGPRNDVHLLQSYLRQRGITSEDTTVLTDGTAEAELPTRAAILESLSRLEGQAKEGDFVVLVFAGHGSQQPSRGDSGSGPDGLDEIFLPRDVGHWDGPSGTVQNAITDSEFGAAIGQMRSRGAFVWAVFDTGHSPTTRSDTQSPGEQDRVVTPAQLGIPPSVMDRARRKAAKARNAASTQRGTGGTYLGLRQRSEADSGGYVIFYAAQREEGAPQRLLPAYSKQRELHGLFTFTLFRSLTSRPLATYRQVMERVVQEYQGLGVELSTPGFEGTALDAPVLGVTSSDPKWAEAYARPVDLSVDFALHVAMPVAGKFCEAPDEFLKRAISEISTDAGLATRVAWVPADAAADVRLCEKSGRLLFLDALGTTAPRQPSLHNSLSLQAADAPPTPGSTLTPFAATLLDSLERVGRVVNLYRIAAALPGSDPLVKVALDYCRGAGKPGLEICHPIKMSAESHPVLHDSDVIRVRLTNLSLQPVDVTVLRVDAGYTITPVFPERHEPWGYARLPQRSKPVDFQVRLDAVDVGPERLIVIAMPPSGGLTQLLEEARSESNTSGVLKTAGTSAAATIATFDWTIGPTPSASGSH